MCLHELGVRVLVCMSQTCVCVALAWRLLCGVVCVCLPPKGVDDIIAAYAQDFTSIKVVAAPAPARPVTVGFVGVGSMGGGMVKVGLGTAGNQGGVGRGGSDLVIPHHAPSALVEAWVLCWWWWW